MVQLWIPKQLKYLVLCSWCSSEFSSTSNLWFCVHGAVLSFNAPQISGFVFMVQFRVLKHFKSNDLCSWCSSLFPSISDLRLCSWCSSEVFIQISNLKSNLGFWAGIWRRMYDILCILTLRSEENSLKKHNQLCMFHRYMTQTITCLGHFFKL